MSKTEQKACLSTSPFPDTTTLSKPLPRHPPASRTETKLSPPRRWRISSPNLRSSNRNKNKNEKPDWFLVFCFILVYLELGWLILLLLRSYSRY